MTKSTLFRVVWCVVVAAVFFWNVYIGVLLGLATVFYWLLDKRLTPKKKLGRLSDTREIQLAFQTEMMLVLKESLGEMGELVHIPRSPSGIIDGNGWLKIDSLWVKTLPDVGMNPSQVKAFKTLVYLLAQCSRVEATKQNLKTFEPLFHPQHPITPQVADAYEEVVKSLTDAIEPQYAEVS